jgi:predicted nucleic acid-binding protein
MEKARTALTDLGKMALKCYPTADLATQALDIAIDKHITAYDACYVALALKLSVPFVTADEKLARALSGTKYQVHWLGDFPIPTVPPQAAN